MPGRERRKWFDRFHCARLCHGRDVPIVHRVTRSLYDIVEPLFVLLERFFGFVQLLRFKSQETFERFAPAFRFPACLADLSQEFAPGLCAEQPIAETLELGFAAGCG